MASSGFATPSLNWSSPNLPEAFRSFRQYSTLIFDGPFANKTEKEKVTYLLLWIGSHGRDIYDGWTWNTPEEKFRLQIVLERFQRHIEPQVNSYLARYTFHQCRQAADESVDEFIARCRVIAAKCKFTDLMETNIRLTEQLIVGTKHVEVQEKLLEKGDALASLEAAMDIARTFEATKAHVAQLQATGPLQVHAVASKRTSSSRPPCSRCNVARIEMGGMPSAPTEVSRLWQTRTLRSVLSHWIVANECIIEDKRSAKTKVVWSEERNVRRKECQQRGRCGGGFRNTHLRGCGDQRHLD